MTEQARVHMHTQVHTHTSAHTQVHTHTTSTSLLIPFNFILESLLSGIPHPWVSSPLGSLPLISSKCTSPSTQYQAYITKKFFVMQRK